MTIPTPDSLSLSAFQYSKITFYNHGAVILFAHADLFMRTKPYHIISLTIQYYQPTNLCFTTLYPLLTNTTVIIVFTNNLQVSLFKAVSGSWAVHPLEDAVALAAISPRISLL